jgi:hypothetical protein
MTTCRVPCGGDTDCPDPSFSRCEPASQSCVRCLADEDCAKQDPYWTRCSPGHGCFECEVDLDCTGNPAALGPHCSIWDTGGSSCICMSGAECAGNPNGPKCLDSTCSCQGDDDCPAPRRCVRPAQPILASWKATVCQ